MLTGIATKSKTWKSVEAIPIEINIKYLEEVKGEGLEVNNSHWVDVETTAQALSFLE